MARFKRYILISNKLLISKEMVVLIRIFINSCQGRKSLSGTVNDDGPYFVLRLTMKESRRLKKSSQDL